jgi:hypothetical protein
LIIPEARNPLYQNPGHPMNLCIPADISSQKVERGLWKGTGDATGSCGKLMAETGMCSFIHVITQEVLA